MRSVPCAAIRLGGGIVAALWCVYVFSREGTVPTVFLGFVAFTYGKRMRHWTPMICGLILMLLPLFVADLALLLTSALLGATAIVFRHS